MNIWIVNPYGTLPSEGWREYRSQMLADALAARGHTVTWWISDFTHRGKTYRLPEAFLDPLLPSGVRVIGVHSTPYERNISWGRIQYEKNFGRELARLAESEAKPDVIVLGDPSLFFGQPVLEYRNRTGCRLVLDVIDLWPELFSVALPRFLQPFGHLIFSPLYRRRARLISQCDGVVAVSKDYLHTAIAGLVGRKIPSLVAYCGLNGRDFEQAVVNLALDAELKRFKAKGCMAVVYAGTLGDAYDMNIVARAVKYSNQHQLPIQFLVAGEGPRRPTFQTLERDFPEQIKFLGQLPASDMRTLYENSDVGLMTYVQGSTVAMPIKFFDYLAGGVAVLNSLERDVRAAIDENDVGLNYEPSNLDDLMDKLRYLLAHSEQLHRFKFNAKNLATAYDSRVQYRNFAEFIEQISGL